MTTKILDLYGRSKEPFVALQPQVADSWSVILELKELNGLDRFLFTDEVFCAFAPVAGQFCTSIDLKFSSLVFVK